MTERLREICSRLHAVETFADVGCDHGYCTRYMLENGLCERAYISDISAASLKKAEDLLRNYINAGKCVSVCADGLEGIGKPCDLVLIAGLGGEEIVRILQKEIPAAFVLQPMKNTEKVRAFLSERGCSVQADYTFEDGKFYDLIVGKKDGGAEYSDWEIRFGRDNLRAPSQAFLNKIKQETGRLKTRLLAPMKRESREELRRRLYDLEVICDAIDGDL